MGKNHDLLVVGTKIFLIDREEKESYIFTIWRLRFVRRKKNNSENSQMPTGVMVIMKRTAHPVMRLSVKRVKLLWTATCCRSYNSVTCILFTMIFDVHDVFELLVCTGMFYLHITSVQYKPQGLLCSCGGLLWMSHLMGSLSKAYLGLLLTCQKTTNSLTLGLRDRLADG